MLTSLHVLIFIYISFFHLLLFIILKKCVTQTETLTLVFHLCDTEVAGYPLPRCHLDGVFWFMMLSSFLGHSEQVKHKSVCLDNERSDLTFVMLWVGFQARLGWYMQRQIEAGKNRVAHRAIPSVYLGWMVLSEAINKTYVSRKHSNNLYLQSGQVYKGLLKSIPYDSHKNEPWIQKTACLYWLSHHIWFIYSSQELFSEEIYFEI